MTTREFASVVLKLTGVWAIVAALLELKNFFFFLQWFFSGGADGVLSGLTLASSGLLPIVIAAVGAGLIGYSNPIAGRLVEEDKELALPGPKSGMELQAILFAVAGALIFLLGIPSLIGATSNLIDNYRGELKSGVFRLLPAFIAACAQMVLAVWLFFGARGLARFWHGFRNAGLEEKPGE